MIDHQKPVRVFKNWKHGCYNIMQEGCIKASASQVRLVDVEFRVRESGRQRMLIGNKRNVHAFAVGRLCDYVHPEDGRRLEPVRGRGVHYNPRIHTSFVDRENDSPVTRASVAHFDEAGVIYLDEAA
ncbi:MAG: hypothetical protein ACR2RL_09555 [Gammaproteobacteria bacterium]